MISLSLLIHISCLITGYGGGYGNYYRPYYGTCLSFCNKIGLLHQDCIMKKLLFM